jgi:hypothetical protein
MMNNPLSHAPEATAAELRGRCGSCSHIWVVAHLPLGLREVAALAGRASCPKCACTKVFVDTQPSPTVESQPAGEVKHG